MLPLGKITRSERRLPLFSVADCDKHSIKLLLLLEECTEIPSVEGLPWEGYISEVTDASPPKTERRDKI